MKPQDKQIPRRVALSICKGLFERLGELIDRILRASSQAGNRGD